MDSERSLKDWLDGFMELTEESEPPVLFRKWSGISAIASALQRKCFLRLGISLVFYPNFYIVLVGPSASRKGTAMKYAYDIISRIPSIHLTAQATSLQALIRSMRSVNLTDIDVKTGKQMFHSSITIFSNEFTVFLGYNDQKLISALCDWYDCHDEWTYDTISRDKEKVIGVWVNLLAGTTPDNIRSSLPMEAIGGGLTSRIIFVYEERKNKLVVFPPCTDELINLQKQLINDLEQISLMCGEFHLTEEASRYYYAWCTLQEEHPPFRSRKLEKYVERRRNHLLSLSMVCSASRNNDLTITESDIARAADLLAEVEVKMPLTFKGTGRNELASVIHDINAFLLRQGTEMIPISKILEEFEGDVDKYELTRIIDTLDAAGIATFVSTPKGQFIKLLNH